MTRTRTKRRASGACSWRWNCAMKNGRLTEAIVVVVVAVAAAVVVVVVICSIGAVVAAIVLDSTGSDWKTVTCSQEDCVCACKMDSFLLKVDK